MAQTTRLRLQPYEWVASDRDGRYSLRIYTHSPDIKEKPSERVVIRVEDYEPFCRMQLPDIVDGRKVKWTEDALKVYAAWIRSTLQHDAPTRIEYRESQKTIYFRNGTKYPFFTCYFQTEEAMSHCVKLINKQGYPIQQLGYIKSRIWETSITSIHRFLTDAQLGYGQWFDVDATKVSEIDKITRCENEYIAHAKDFKSAPEDETNDLKTSPMECAIDIEQYSANHRAMPNKDFVTDEVFAISVISKRMGRTETQQKHLLVVGLCDDIPGATVHRFDHEIQMIDAMCKLLVQVDPSVILGYNVFKYDFPVLDARMKLYLRDWLSCGLVKDQPSSIKTKSWKSSAYGYQTIATLESEGRICIDMYTIINRDHKLDRYTLDHVSKHFLDRGKHDVTAKEMFEIRAECRDAVTEEEKKVAAVKMAKVGAYCLEDSCLCIDLFECPQLSTWLAIIELSITACVTPLATFTQGQQVRVQNQVYQWAYRLGFVIDEREGSKDGFVGGKVQDPIPGRYKNILIFDFASLYPSIIRAFNICYTTLIPPESDIPDSMCNVLAWSEEDRYYRYRFIKKEHFVGILPRMCEYLTNKRASVRDKINPNNEPYVNSKYNQQQLGLKVTNNSIFGALGVSEGRMPLPEGARCITAMGRQLITIAADHVRTKHKGKIVYGDTDSIMVDLGITDPLQCIHWGEALSKEITALYPDPLRLEFERGYSIAFFVKKKMYAGFPLSIIKFAKGDILEVLPYEGDEYLYRVTMMRNGKKEVKHLSISKEILICSELKDKVIVESVDKAKGITTFEGGSTAPAVIAGTPRSSTGGPDPKSLVVKGIILARRDNCLWIREVYKDVLMGIMFGRTLKETMEVIDREIVKMMSREVPFNKMMVTRGVGANYKPNSTYFMKLFLDEMKLRGFNIQPGERVDYVLVKCKEEWRNEKQGLKMRTPDLYWQGCHEEPIDRLHYIEKVMKNSIEQIFYLAYKEQIDQSEEKFTPKPRKRSKLYTYLSHDYINSWVKILKYKDKLVKEITTMKPHFGNQREYLVQSFS